MKIRTVNEFLRRLTFAIVAALLPFAATFGQTVTNVRVAVQGKSVVVTYDLTGGASGEKFSVKLYYSSDGGRTYGSPLRSVSGDVGEKVTGGSNKKIVWDVLRDVESVIGESDSHYEEKVEK